MFETANQIWNFMNMNLNMTCIIQSEYFSESYLIFLHEDNTVV
jgi:hypothetical protein